MAKFRKNHNTGYGAKSTLARYFSFTLGIVIIIGILYINSKKYVEEKGLYDEYNIPNSLETGEVYFLPSGSKGEIVHHKYYSLSYLEKHEQAEWVAYELTRKSLKVKNVKRAKEFKTDYNLSTLSAFHRDYSHSGYTRGHMVPAGDMAFNELAMQESFYMSNMSPQLSALNNGIWKELEEQVRDWAYSDKRIYIVTGPMLNRPRLKTIGKQRKITVPSAFYKVILDIDKPKRKGIAFVIPNEKSENKLQEYAMSIDDLESELGFDLFANLISEDAQEVIESNYNINDWKFSENRYRDRVEQWNDQ
jgi:endonuclease G, mitochondrial